jgi:hypothetical protein
MIHGVNLFSIFILQYFRMSRESTNVADHYFFHAPLIPRHAPLRPRSEYEPTN